MSLSIDDVDTHPSSLESFFDLKRDVGESRKKAASKEDEEESPNDEKEPQRAPKRKGQKSNNGEDGGKPWAC